MTVSYATVHFQYLTQVPDPQYILSEHLLYGWMDG